MTDMAEADATEGCEGNHAQRKAPAFDRHTLETAAAFFRAAGEPNRLRVLLLLRDGEWCVSELAAATDEPTPSVSQRLKVLRAERLVQRRRVGKHVRYRLADEHVASLLEAALAHAEDHERQQAGPWPAPDESTDAPHAAPTARTPQGTVRR